MIAEWMPRCGAAAIGPGMGRGEEAGELFSWFWNNWRAPLLIDADMLYFFARNLDELKERDNVLLTPHGGEAARILGVSAAEVGASREKSARALTRKAGQALLKGRNTLIASSSGELRMIAAGSPALAVPRFRRRAERRYRRAYGLRPFGYGRGGRRSARARRGGGEA